MHFCECHSRKCHYYYNYYKNTLRNLNPIDNNEYRTKMDVGIKRNVPDTEIKTKNLFSFSLITT